VPAAPKAARWLGGTAVRKTTGSETKMRALRRLPPSETLITSDFEEEVAVEWEGSYGCVPQGLCWASLSSLFTRTEVAFSLTVRSNRRALLAGIERKASTSWRQF
jgi:hypothetical protein